MWCLKLLHLSALWLNEGLTCFSQILNVNDQVLIWIQISLREWFCIKQQTRDTMLWIRVLKKPRKATLRKCACQPFYELFTTTLSHMYSCDDRSIQNTNQRTSHADKRNWAVTFILLLSLFSGILGLLQKKVINVKIKLKYGLENIYILMQTVCWG